MQERLELSVNADMSLRDIGQTRLIGALNAVNVARVHNLLSYETLDSPSIKQSQPEVNRETKRQVYLITNKLRNVDALKIGV